MPLSSNCCAIYLQINFCALNITKISLKNMKKILANTNGWQRLFLSCVLFIYLPIAWFMFPTNPWLSLPSNDEFLKLIPTEMLEAMAEEKIHIKFGEKTDFVDYLKTDESKFEFISVNSAEYSGRMVTLKISKEIKEDRRKKMVDDLEASLKKSHDSEIFYEQLLYVVYSFCGLIFIYAFGMAVGWVTRGFKKI